MADHHRPERPRTYGLLGHERIVLTRNDVESLVRENLLDANTMVIGEGEAFAVAIGARPEFRHLAKLRTKGAPPR
jgi:hypothetical protein